ncbi:MULTISPECIES: RHS repeat domain-containing protein [Pseudomonas]|uniref:RHS repeat-associated core domain-containing protein n=2 Tax=Pseudomonas fragariae (ex Marin et al. 2024) TaxID=3080056 RepID=A0ABU5B947_9PSED|nr:MULTISPECIES: RHS repeat-associated core domain-containing protein [Pseudomonas]MCW6057784.1 RHS domain-containing protein [Pseudomonas fragi]MCH5488879.1 RHS domain-containing protein [Pseudomonas syringae pv. syringae]MDO1459741.1 RHS domain-containing protein [Pseudomonas syringae pv. syringae]MDV0427869.1 RHS repeat-associated core domain-containing protein [Pseudomonas sp. 17]MDX9573656.1 RHS repeat-associated core domain-containing protein [Pseudomonas sp. 21(2023)]
MQIIKKLFRKVSVAMLALVVTHAALANTVTYFHNDISGSPMVATDETGNLLWKESYKPYGEKLTQTSPSSSNKIGFHGKVFDDNSGLSYMGARYYDPLLGRFMGADPVDFQESNLHSFNRYAYANNNPYKFSDPSGLYADLIIETMSLAVGMASFHQNVKEGNYGAAALDGVGIAADGVLAAIPMVPGAAGLAIQGARGLERASDIRPHLDNATSSGAPDFLISPNGTVFPVPKGATGPSPNVNRAGNITGSAFINGKGGDNGQVSALRLMNPTRPLGKNPGYKNGYIKYENRLDQGVDPYTGRTLSHSKSHFPIE